MSNNSNLVVAIGASAGGLKEILTIVNSLSPSFAGSLVIATHRSPENGSMLADILRFHTNVKVSQPIHNGSLSCSTVYVGDAAERVEVGEDGNFDVFQDSSKFARCRRIDDLFISVAETCGPNAIGVVLSGMLEDGVLGLSSISKAGGHCIVQDPADASYESMPSRALDEVNVDFVGTAAEIGKHLVAIAATRVCRD